MLQAQASALGRGRRGTGFGQTQAPVGGDQFLQTHLEDRRHGAALLQGQGTPHQIVVRTDRGLHRSSLSGRRHGGHGGQRADGLDRRRRLAYTAPRR